MRRPPSAGEKSRPSPSNKAREMHLKDHLRMTKESFMERAEADNDHSAARKAKKCLSNLDIFKQIINERHAIVKLNKADSYKRVAKKVVTPTLRNGIITRVFSRSKLELFTRPDPNDLTQNLKSRVNSIVKNLEVTIKPERRQLATRLLKFNRHHTENKSLDPLLETERAKMRTLADQSTVTMSQSRRELSLKDFPMERLAIKEVQENNKTKRMSSSSREKRPISLNFCLHKPSSNTSSDFFPQRYNLCADKDRAIVKAFGQSFTSSAKSMLKRNRVAAVFSKKA